MSGEEHKNVIVTAWQAGRISYVEALRRLLDLGFAPDDATRWLAAKMPAGTESGDEGTS